MPDDKIGFVLKSVGQRLPSVSSKKWPRMHVIGRCSALKWIRMKVGKNWRYSGEQSRFLPLFRLPHCDIHSGYVVGGSPEFGVVRVFPALFGRTAPG